MMEEGEWPEAQGLASQFHEINTRQGSVDKAAVVEVVGHRCLRHPVRGAATQSNPFEHSLHVSF